MKKLFYVTTNEDNVIVSYDSEEKIAMIFDARGEDYQTESEDKALEILRLIEDDSSWDRTDNVEDISQFIGIDNEETKILAQIDFE